MKFDDLPAAWELKQDRALHVKKRAEAAAHGDNELRDREQAIIDEIDKRLRALGVEPPREEG